MAKSKEEQILIQEGTTVIELTGIDKENFIAERQLKNEERKFREEQLKLQKELKISAYKKLGLTDEEIAAII